MDSALPSGLIYYPDDRPGISRRRCGRGFTYAGPDGTTIARGPERKRIEKLAIPPAYADVWISPKTNGHLQATGRDARTRKQYRYHEKWSEARAAEKFDRLAEFGRALPRIRRRIKRDLTEDPGDEAFALAAAALLIDRLALRVGNESYTRENGSYGALTLRRRHVTLANDTLRLQYTAKGGKKVRRKISDKTLLRTLEKVRDLPGAELVTWVDDAGAARSISSGALNDFLAEAGSGDFSAKTFRTWAGTLAAFEAAENGADTIKALSEAAAKRLSNTPTVARNSYIHPKVIKLTDGWPDTDTTKRMDGLSAAEARLLALLEG